MTSAYGKLKRVSDLAKNISEATIYTETGALGTIKQREDRDTV
ncbi:hypothetical protein OAP51_02355 [Alphaproteobacteria bacterium]|nr:hypothetical protein [Alphaproteobacteria bacterium]